MNDSIKAKELVWEKDVMLCRGVEGCYRPTAEIIHEAVGITKRFYVKEAMVVEETKDGDLIFVKKYLYWESKKQEVEHFYEFARTSKVSSVEEGKERAQRRNNEHARKAYERLMSKIVKE